MTDEKIRALFLKYCVGHPGNYEVTPGQAVLIGREVEAPLRERIRVLEDALRAALVSLKRGDFYEGVCCCGADMENHADPMLAGHSPTDAGEYHAYNTQKRIEDLLEDKP